MTAPHTLTLNMHGRDGTTSGYCMLKGNKLQESTFRPDCWIAEPMSANAASAPHTLTLSPCTAVTAPHPATLYKLKGNKLQIEVNIQA